MFTLWVLLHAILIGCRVIVPVGDRYESVFHLIACTVLPTVAAFALIFQTAILVRIFCGRARSRGGRMAPLAMEVFAYTIGLGALTASFGFAYPVGFSIGARVAFVAFAVATCGVLSAGKLALD